MVKEAINKIESPTNKEFFKISDYWDVESFTEEQFRQLNRSLSLFIRTKIGNPVYYDGDQLKINESVENVTKSVEEVKKDLINNLNFEDWQIISQNGCNGIKVILLFAGIGDNEEIIEKEMESLGWVKTTMTVDNNWVPPLKAISFDPMYLPEIEGPAKRWKYFFHISPEYNEKSILKNGLTPSAKNRIFKYPPRVYLLKPLIPIENVRSLAEILYKADDAPENNGKYDIFQVFTRAIPEDVKLYYDPRYEFGVYTEQPIPSLALNFYSSLNVKKI
jgi:hypothetical protein